MGKGKCRREQDQRQNKGSKGVYIFSFSYSCPCVHMILGVTNPFKNQQLNSDSSHIRDVFKNTLGKSTEASCAQLCSEHKRAPSSTVLHRPLRPASSITTYIQIVVLRWYFLRFIRSINGDYRVFLSRSTSSLVDSHLS